jgi:hypothetical protein
LNEPDQAEFSFPRNAYTYSQIPVLGTASGVREVQFYRDDDLLFWGPVISADTNAADGQVSCSAAGVDWYLNRRAIDGARDNALTNPQFESGLTGWTAVGSFVATTSTTTKVLGSTSLKLQNSDGGEDSYLYQTAVADAGGVGDLYTLSGWYFVESGVTGENDGALGSRGIYMAAYDEALALQDYDYIPIDLASPRNVWTRGELTLRVPANRTWLLNVRLYAPKGVVYYDALQLVRMESVSTASLTDSTTAEVDITRIVRMLVSHAQSSDVGKSDVNIGYSGSTTGQTSTKHYQYADHVQFDQALAEFIERDDVGDYSIAYTPTTRSLTLHTPRKGTDRSGSVTLTYGSNISAYRIVRDGAGTITRATVLGDGDGPDREEGEYADASDVGGLILQDVRSAPSKTNINALLPIARDVVAKNGTVPTIVECDILPSANLIHTLKTGDIVAVVISDGWVSINGDYRIVQWSLDCQTSVLTVTLNEE